MVNHDVVIYNFRLEIVEELLVKGFEVHISSPYGERIDELVALGCIFHETSINRHSTNLIGELKLLRNYYKLLKELNPDIVFTFTIKPNIYGGIISRLLSIPYVANITGLGTAVEEDGWLQKLSIMLYRFAFKKIDKIFLQNEENKQFFVENKIKIEKLEVIPGSGVNIERFPLLEFPGSKTIEFAFISRIMKEKGIDEVLEAAQKIRSLYPNTRFHICGFLEDDYKEILENAQKNGDIIYHGMIRDVKDVLEKVHCTIHPTFYPEGLSNVLLESAACGRALITTDRSGCREVVDEGVNGFLIKPKRPEELIEKITDFIEMDYEAKKRMGQLGREKVALEYNRSTVVNRYLELAATLT